VTIPNLAMVVAVGPLDRAKSRLASALDADDRRALVLAMLDDVLRAIRAAHDGTLLVVTPDDDVSPVAASYSAELLRDRGEGTNAAIVDALASGTVRNSDAVIVIQGDLPQLLPAHVSAIAHALAALESPAAVLVPNEDGGTSGLALCPPSAMPTAFGPNSGAGHRDSAATSSVTLEELAIAELASDVDTIEDLERVGRSAGPATSALLERLGVTVP